MRPNFAPAAAALVALPLLLATTAAADSTLLLRGAAQPGDDNKAKAEAAGVFFSDAFDKHPVGKAPPAPWSTTLSKGTFAAAAARLALAPQSALYTNQRPYTQKKNNRRRDGRRFHAGCQGPARHVRTFRCPHIKTPVTSLFSGIYPRTTILHNTKKRQDRGRGRGQDRLCDADEPDGGRPKQVLRAPAVLPGLRPGYVVCKAIWNSTRMSIHLSHNTTPHHSK